MKVLETEGLEIQSTSYKGKVFFVVGQVTGDNLGMNALCGYVQSFSANYPCRMCRMHRNDMQTATQEDAAILRTRLNHDRGLDLPVSESGLNFDSPLNELKYFHVTENRVLDIMHDILEGVCMIEMKLVLCALIEAGHFTRDCLNARMESFDYGFSDARNKPSPFSQSCLQNTSSATGQSASQAWCLIRHLPLIVGDLVPEGNEFWELLLMLLDCMDLIFAPEISKNATIYLQQLIQDHHSYFLQLFPERHLLAKHHFMQARSQGGGRGGGSYDPPPVAHPKDFVPPFSNFVPPFSNFVPPFSNFVPPFSNFVPPFSNFVPPFSNFVPPFSNFVPPFSNFVPPFSNFVPPLEYVDDVTRAMSKGGGGCL